MSEEQKSWTVDNSTVASNPGRLRVSRIRWLVHYPTWPIVWATGLTLFIFLACLVHWGFWIPAVFFLVMNWFYWIRVGEHFRQGCVNSAVVVGIDPMLIAVSTDLSKGDGAYPVIKIVKTQLLRIGGQLPQLGDRLATVSLYSASTDPALPHWVDFNPRPVDCATSDHTENARIMSTIPQAEWKELEKGLHQLPQPYRPGLFHLESKGE